MSKRTLSFLILALFSVLLAGCTEVNQEITADSEGFWNEYVIYPFSQFITATSNLVGGYGLGIVVVTIIIRIIILPLMIKQTKSAKAMQMVQPEMQKLREKYKSKDAQTQQKLQQETMALFQKHGINPLAGCFPILVQMPIIIGLYQAIMRTAEIKEHTFLWFDLGSPDIILSILAGVFTFFQQKLMMAGTANQNPQLAMMLWLMPIMIIIFGITLPAALSLYWVVGSIFMIVQTLVINGPNKVQDPSIM
ncbi:YidC family membrane integrase SpoIIIJ [Domibacillus epiphyticus]|uniref:Membrane protein insertase YidC n=1 Tax=Domibacillus epiphyticus TaxID=1714355 RepID=A0A1V2A5Y2_9BACI|nr:YidC family membrane integrase SpoIIIJ [Domibacillus epiphyticus]OMP66396.1 OxaA precursor [Domibacillus epiphyticus]